MSSSESREEPLRSGEKPRRLGWRAAAFSAVTAVITAAAAILVNFLTSAEGAPLDRLDQAATVLSLILTAAGVFFAYLVWRSAQRRGPDGGDDGSARSTEQRIEDATRSLRITAELVDELQVEMQAKVATLDRLRAENEEFEKLAALRREEAEAVSRLIERVIGSAHSQLGRTSRRDQALFFLAGLATSIPMQLLINWLA